jgi:DNA-binding response OmpR family regulator
MRLPVLLLDSDADAAIQLAAQLRHAGFAIEMVSTASEALDVLGFRVCSVVIVVADLVDDEECLQCLTDLRHAAPKAWMLVVTDDPPERGIESVRECGADELMVTPFSLAVLVQYLATHIRLPRPLS